MIWLQLFRFFFQAEDGIRDRTVTGVQTCALPISAGGFGGATDSQTASGTLAVLALRDLVLAFTPAYTTSASLSSRQTTRVDVQTFALTLGGLYRIAQYVAVFAGYSLLHQRTGGPPSQQANIDQNRVRIGLQFGYPIHFD